MLVGCALALAGLLFQVVLKNPLADPGIIGISAGAQLVSLLVGIFFTWFIYHQTIVNMFRRISYICF